MPSLHVEIPGTWDEGKYWEEKKYEFEKELDSDFQWLRTPEPGRIFKIGNGKLTLFGRESVGSWFEQTLVARRQTHFSFDAETALDFSPIDERQFAGLVVYYSRYNFFYLTVIAHADGQRELLIMSSEASFPDGKLQMPLAEPVKIPNEGTVKLALEIRGDRLQFSYSLDGEEMKNIGRIYDASIVSDECGGQKDHGSFTGSFVGMAASDLNGIVTEAKFDYFVYRPVRYETDRYDI